MSVSSSDSLLIVGDEEPKANKETKVEPRPPEMKSMHVVSNVRNRYGRTVVTSKYVNQDKHAQQATFSIVLPDTAFIAGFVMEINEKKYEAYVKEKEEAKQEYQAAVSSGRAAAHVAVSTRDSNKFTVSVNVEPQSDVTFILTYEELLVRKHGKYEMVVNLHPGQLLDDLGVDIYINETRPIVHVETPALRSGNEISDKVTKNEHATIRNDNDGIVHISFNPTVEQQKKMTKALTNKEKKIDTFKQITNEGESNGISGQFVIEYDVERDPLGGEVLVNDGYFVHFFAPTELKPIPKHVIFVLDVSGSMGGRKLKQLKEAMKVILNELNPEDYFNLVKFSNNTSVLDSKQSWSEINIPAESSLPPSFPVNAKNIKTVQNVIDHITDEGGTNIYDALIVGVRLTSKGILHLVESDNKHKPQPIIVFLTDGQANIGESNSKKIIEMVENKNDCDNKSAIFTLAFGNDADNEFLKELAIQNSGFLRNIYEAADASLQLQDFYKQISSPLLTNINFKYPADVKEVTKQKFDILFDGSEFVVAGKVDDMVDGFVFVEGSTLDGINKFYPTLITSCPKPDVKEEYGSLERLWAYMTIKQLLCKKYEKVTSVSNDNHPDKNTEKLENEKNEKAEKHALQLALQYSFVTPVTSLVVSKPDEPTAEAHLTLDEPAVEAQFEYKQEILRCLGFKSVTDSSVNSRADSLAFSLVGDSSHYSSGFSSKMSLKSKTGSFSMFDKIAQLFTTKSKDANLKEDLVLKSIRVDCNVRNQETEGNVFETNKRDKKHAKKDYKVAVASGVDAAFVNLQDVTKATVTVHLAPHSEVIFMFKYEKCLQAKDGKHEIVINIHREKCTEELTVNMNLTEATRIKNIKTPVLRSQNVVIDNENAIVNRTNDNEVHIVFSATVEQQEELVIALKGTDGNVSGQFIVEYEVEPNPSAAQNSVSITPIPIPSYLVAVRNTS